MDRNTPPPVLAALERLPADTARRCMDGVDRWLDHTRRVLAAAAGGARVAPLYRRPVHEQLQEEADRRAALGDRTWTVWEAWSAELRKNAAR